MKLKRKSKEDRLKATALTKGLTLTFIDGKRIYTCNLCGTHPTIAHKIGCPNITWSAHMPPSMSSGPIFGTDTRKIERLLETIVKDLAEIKAALPEPVIH